MSIPFVQCFTIQDCIWNAPIGLFLLALLALIGTFFVLHYFFRIISAI